MAKQCTKCGKALPREDTRYCNNCGKTFPYTRPVKYALPDEPPAWMKQLENIISDAKPRGKYDNHFINASTSITSTISSNHVQASNTKSENTEAEPASQDPEPVSPQEVSLHNGISRDNADTSTSEVAQPAKTLTNIPLRELRVKVWEQEEIVKDHALPEVDRGTIKDGQNADVVEDSPTRPLLAADTAGRTKQPLSISNQTVKSVDDKEIVDDLPTRPLVASLPETPTIRHASVSPAKSNGRVSHSDEVEELDTRPLMALRQGQTMSPVVGNPAAQAQHMQAVRIPVEPAQNPHGSVLQRPITPELFSQPQVAPAQALKHTPPISVTVPPVARPKRKSRKRPVFVFALLFILVAGGVSTWLIVSQPFTVPEITQTTQAFQDTGLGLSLRYPQTWTAELDKINQAVYFYDDNHTDQVNISAVAASAPSTQSVDGYIEKEVDSLGITGQKAKPSLSFAGVSWQQVQGNRLQSGASYTAVLLVTMHAGHYYTILQLAPLTTYAQEDQLVFSNMRSSFQFI